MSAFDASDFGWQGSRSLPSDKEGISSRDHKRRRSRSRDRSRRRRGSRNRSPEQRRERRYRSNSPRGDRREAPSSPSLYHSNTRPSAIGSAVHNNSSSSGVLSHHERPRITQLPFEHCGEPISDWWCPTCSNPNPQVRWDCQKCGSLHTTDTSIRPTTELMTDFIAPGMIPSMLLAARRGEYNQGIASADLASLVSAYDAAMGGCPLERRNAEMRALEVLVQSVLKSKAECNHTLMYACVVEEALSPALATLRVGLGADGGTAGGMNRPDADDSGYVVCLRFYSVADAKQCLLGVQSCIALPGLTTHGGSRFAIDGRIRVGFSPRRAIPKPPSRPYTGSGSKQAPILDIHEEQPISEAPFVWVPPTFHNDDALKAFLVELFNQWDTILPVQKAFYEANIGKVTQQRQQPPQASPSMPAAAAAVVAPNAQEGPSAQAMKKKMEEKRLELAAKRKLLEAQQGSTPQEAVAPPVALAPAAPTATGLTVLERLAQKKALLQAQQQEQAQQQTKITQDQVPEQRQPATTGAPQATPVVLLVHQLVPMPPNFPSKTDYIKQCKLINPKAVVKLNGIPMDVASRVLNPKFL